MLFSETLFRSLEETGVILLNGLHSYRWNPFYSSRFNRFSQGLAVFQDTAVMSCLQRRTLLASNIRIKRFSYWYFSIQE